MVEEVTEGVAVDVTVKTDADVAVRTPVVEEVVEGAVVEEVLSVAVLDEVIEVAAVDEEVGLGVVEEATEDKVEVDMAVEEDTVIEGSAADDEVEVALSVPGKRDLGKGSGLRIKEQGEKRSLMSEIKKRGLVVGG